MRVYEYHHTVSFEETNLVGNVYYANHIRWQGRCREMFLRDHAPEVLAMLSNDLALVTTHVSCDYFAELFAFDNIILCMHLKGIAQNRITMAFEYQRGSQLVARGEQQVACMKRADGRVVATPIPEPLRQALTSYTDASLELG